MPLTATLASAPDLTAADTDAMYALMTTHYRHVRRDAFDQDLAAKDWAILLHEPADGRLRGFSTQVRFDHVHQGEPLRILFSGDTIIHPDFWGGMQLPILFGRMMQAIQRDTPHQRLYWMLISKGFRTYRFLPTFFHSFYPRRDRPTPPPEQALMHALGRRRFAQAYDPDAGIIRAGQDAQSLRPAVAHDRCRTARPDPHIEFFHRANPGWARGDELLCLAEFSEDNLKPFILRQLNRGRVVLPRAPAEAAG